MLDMNMWMGVIALTAALYGVKWWITSTRKVRVYRISPESLKRAKEVLVAVLPLVEDGESFPLDQKRLHYSKEDIKSAAKILAYYFWRRKQHDELARVKQCFVAVSRFQDTTADLETQERQASREHAQLERELSYYMTHSPFNAKRSD